MLRALTAQDEAAANHDSITEDHLITMLVTTLAMLAALNPIQPPRRPNQSNQQPASSSSSTIQPQPASESAPLEHNQTIPSCQVSAHTGTNQPGPDVANLHTSDNLHGLQLQATTPSAAGPDCQDLNHIEAHCPVDQALNQQAAGTAEELIRLARQYPKQSLYKCYRCDLVALLANLCFRRHAVQQKVQQLGGVELILSQCQVQHLVLVILGVMMLLTRLLRILLHQKCAIHRDDDSRIGSFVLFLCRPLLPCQMSRDSVCMYG